MKYPSTALIFVLSAAIWLAACGRHEAPVPGAPAAPSAAGASQATVAPYTLPSQPLAAGGNCALDSIDGKPSNGASLKAGTTIRFAGWMGDAQVNVPTQALLVLQGEAKSYSVGIVGGGLRPDVATALGAPGLANAGYNSDVTLADVAPGLYKVSIANTGAAQQSCDLKVSISIVP